VWHAGYPPSHNVPLHTVLVPAKATPSDTQTRSASETDADYRTTAAASRLAPFPAGVPALGLPNNLHYDQRVIPDAVRLQQMFQPRSLFVERVNHHRRGAQLLLQLVFANARWVISSPEKANVDSSILSLGTTSHFLL